MESPGDLNSQHSLKKKNKTRGFTVYNFKTYYKSIVMKQRDTGIKIHIQTNEIE